MMTVKTKDIEEPGDKSEFDGVISPRKSKLGGINHIQPWDLQMTISADRKVYFTLCGKEDQQSGKCRAVVSWRSKDLYFSSNNIEELDLESIGSSLGVK